VEACGFEDARAGGAAGTRCGVLIEAGGRGIYQDLVLRRIVADHACWPAGIGREVTIKLMGGMNEEVSRFGGMIGGPELDDAREKQSSIVLVGVVFALKSVTLTLRCV
jgi:hypothetical protein